MVATVSRSVACDTFAPPAQSDFCSFDPMVFCSQCGCRTSMLLLSLINWRSFMLSRRPSIRRIFGIQDLDHGCCSISTSDSRYSCYSSQAVLRKHAAFSSYHRCSSHIQSHSRFIAIVLRAISSPCHRYRYPPCSTEPIPLVLILLSYRPRHSITVALQSHRRCGRHLSLSSYLLALILSLLWTSSLSSSTSMSQITASKPRRSSAPREGVLS
jgi:hypothetical protein